MKRPVWLGFAALCLLAGSAWVFDEAVPGLLTGLPRTAVDDGVLALAFGLVSLWDSRTTSGGWRFWLKLAAGGVAMFAVPQILLAAAAGRVSGLSGVLVFMLTPVVVIFVMAQKAVGFGEDGNPLRWLGPALAGLGGAALLIPFDLPASAAGRLWLAAILCSAVAAGVGAVRMHGLLQGADVFRGAAAMFGATSVVAGAFGWVDWTGIPDWTWSAFAAEAVRCAAIEAPILLLTVWQLREMRPVGFSARLLLVPLVTIVESYLMTRSALSWTTALGVVLIAGGGAGLSMAKDDAPKNLI